MNRGTGVEACKGAWHAHCYQQLALDNFPVLSAVDLEQSIVNDEAMEEEDPMRFREASVMIVNFGTGVG
jgi:hypothetical protein